MTVSTVLQAPLRMPAEQIRRYRSGSHAVRMLMLGTGAWLLLNIVKWASYGAVFELNDKPWVQVLLNPLGLFLANSAQKDPLWLYLLAGTMRLSVSILPNYLMGKYGTEVIRDSYQRSAEKSGRLWRMGNRLTAHLSRPGNHIRRQATDQAHREPRYAYLFVCLRPNCWTVMLAGGLRLSAARVTAAALTGTVGWLILIGFLSGYVPHWFFLATSIF